MIDHGANLNVKDDNNETPFDKAGSQKCKSFNRFKAMSLLISTINFCCFNFVVKDLLEVKRRFGVKGWLQSIWSKIWWMNPIMINHKQADLKDESNWGKLHVFKNVKSTCEFKIKHLYVIEIEIYQIKTVLREKKNNDRREPKGKLSIQKT